MGQKGSKHKDRSKELNRHSTTVAPSLYPNLANQFPTYGQPTTIDYRVPTSEACFGNSIPFHNVQSHYYNPVPSAPPALPEILGPEISAIAQRSIRQEDGMQTREPETWQNQEGLRTNSDKKPCPNAGDGCKLHFAPDQMKQHVKECLFMEITCPLNGVFGKCAWRDKIKRIKTHFSDVHPSHIGAVNRQMTLDSQRIIQLVDLNPHKFLVQIKLDQDTEKILFIVQLYSTEVSASRWTYEFEFHGPMMANMKPLEGTCIPAGTSVEKKFNKLQCRVLTMSTCAINAFKNGTLEYKYRIMRRDRAMPKKIEGTIDATSKAMTAPKECKGNDVAVVPKRLKKPQKKRPRKPTKTPLECMLAKH